MPSSASCGDPALEGPSLWEAWVQLMAVQWSNITGPVDHVYSHRWVEGCGFTGLAIWCLISSASVLVSLFP